MSELIAVAGATGNLGQRIVRELHALGATVVALVRPDTPPEKLAPLEDKQARIARVDLHQLTDVTRALSGAKCVISTLQGLRDVIVDTQNVLLQAATQAGVRHFIPSDYSTDFRKLKAGENRNFDLRREFANLLDRAAISGTSIFNGAFAEVLSHSPLLDLQKKTVSYWEDADWKVDVSTMDDTASYTASAALDENAPRALCVASFQISPRDLATAASDALQSKFELVKLGTLDELRRYNNAERSAHPEGENEVFPSWQQSQYMQSMFEAHHQKLDNARYPDVHWTSLRDVIGQLASSVEKR